MSIEPVYRYRATAARVIDGDTFEADVDLGFHASIRITVRLHGVDAPEKGKPGAKEATEYLRYLLAPADRLREPLILQSHKDARSFERWVCDAWLATGESVADEIVATGHGVVRWVIPRDEGA